jgi:hypothetical protein
MISLFVKTAEAASSSIPTIALPGNFVADLMGFIGDQLSAWSTYVIAIIGIVAVGLVIGILVDHFRK